MSAALGLCMVGAMPPNPANCGHRVRPGPRPVFTERMVVQVRADQRSAVTRIANVLGMSASEWVRWCIDQGTTAIETVPSFKYLEDHP